MNFLSLSWKLFFVLCLFWLIPVTGWYGSAYLEKQWELAAIAENKQVAKSYHGILQKLLQEDDAFVRQLSLDKTPNQVLVAKRKGPILIDGFADEWYSYNTNQLVARNDQQASTLTLIEDDHFVYGLVEIQDNQVIYRKNPYLTQSNDMLRLDLGYGYWLLQAIAPGRINVQKEFGNGFKTINPVLAIWQETQNGYLIEFRVPKALVGNKISVVLYDVDDKSSKNYQDKFQGVFTFTNFSYFPLSRELNNSWLLANELKQKQLTIINANGQVILQVGNLFNDGAYQNSYNNASRLSNPFTREIVDSGFSDSSVGHKQPDFIARSGYQLELNSEPLGAVILETSLAQDKLLLNKIRWISLIIFALIWLVLLAMVLKQANKFRARIKLLNELTEQANEMDAEEVDLSQIEIQGNDEIDQLSHNLAYYNERLEQRRDHQKKLLARLNHELRTPLAIIGSSLDNLELSELQAEELQLIKNARSGQERLSLSFNRLSEANRLEESIDKVELEWFNLSSLLEDLLSSYKNNWPESEFRLHKDDKNYQVYGSEDLFAQMLDKIISNAIDFSVPNQPIEIELELVKGNLILSVSNNGPLIESEKIKSIFNLMESSRTSSSQSNLGLGLYIAKLIARRHKAKISAMNKADKKGVTLQLVWKKKSYVVLP